jgi:hypothetical protein
MQLGQGGELSLREIIQHVRHENRRMTLHGDAEQESDLVVNPVAWPLAALCGRRMAVESGKGQHAGAGCGPSGAGGFLVQCRHVLRFSFLLTTALNADHYSRM